MRLHDVIEDVVAAVAEEVPAYGRNDGQGADLVLREGVRVALERLMDLLGTEAEALGPAAAVYERIGAGEYRANRPLQAVLAGYRVGALATWRGLSTMSNAAGVDAVTISRLAEACFAYIDEISAASAAGYARAQTADAGRREALRAELVAAIVDPARAGRVAGAAAELGWKVPERLAVAVWRDDRQPAEVVCARLGDLTVAVLGEADLASVRARWLQECSASVGTWGQLDHAAVSYAHAQALDRLRRSGTVRAPGAAVAAEYLPQLLLASDPELAAALVAEQLAPIAALDRQRRAVVVDTLTSWLLNTGSRAAVAAELHIHPQTVAYRMEGIRQSFGGHLATAEGRWRLLLALRAEQQARTEA